MISGELAERSKATVSKIVILLVGIEGSNPSLSAIFFATKKWRTKPQGFTSLCRRHNFTSSRGDSRSSQKQRSLACLSRHSFSDGG